MTTINILSPLRLVLMLLSIETAAQSAREGCIVAELFTSEGCSSCPAADELLDEMISLTANEGKSVVGLAFHVTYWNHRGWTDPYSQEQFTSRQKKYVQTLQNTQLYTPQIVLNGEEVFVGSNPFAFRAAIEEAWSKSTPCMIQGRASVFGDSVKVSYSLDKDPKGILLHVAIVQDSIQHFVSRGENSGRTLHHYNVVRDFFSILPRKEGEIAFMLRQDVPIDRLYVILYVQRKNLKVLGGVKLSLKK